jgi:hypothetical protein
METHFRERCAVQFAKECEKLSGRITLHFKYGSKDLPSAKLTTKLFLEACFRGIEASIINPYYYYRTLKVSIVDLTTSPRLKTSPAPNVDTLPSLNTPMESLNPQCHSFSTFHTRKTPHNTRLDCSSLSSPKFPLSPI